MNDPSLTTTNNPTSAVSDAAPSALTVLASLRDQFPDTPFLALGQTALWDEPTKAALRRALDRDWPDARLIAATHDTDYFAKLPGHPLGREHGSYAVVAHDDARTRGLWSAAGEMSQLFGSEDVPSCDALEAQAGVSLHRALAGAPDDGRPLLAELTAAWGWTGIIYTDWDRKISRDVPLADILPALHDQIDWAIDGSVAALSGARATQMRGAGVSLRDEVAAYARANPTASLTELYRDLTPRLYEMLLDAPAANLEASNTSELLRFNRATASLPRFKFVDLFLNPITRRVALDAYNLAVGGSDIYTLDRFGDGALPFDLVVPGRGRGTICVPGDGTIFVDTPQPITLCDTGCDFSSVAKLADLVERELGTDCTLVGKAVSLLPMLAAEFVLVFHEGASGYSTRTHAMMEHFARRKIALPTLRPILRLRYNTWDSLAAVPPPAGSQDATTFRLPEFLTQAFGQASISLPEFAACWRCAVNREQDRLTRLSTLRSPRELLAYLASEDTAGGWAEAVRTYDTASMTLMRLRDQAQAIQGRIYTFYDQVRAEKAAAARLERAKGDDFRARVQPLRDAMATAGDAAQIAVLQSKIDALQAERGLTFGAEIAGHRGQIRYALAYVRDLKAKRLALERGDESAAARETLRRIEARAELAKARLARNALQTVHGLPHTNHRPTAWWFPLVDPSGAWFSRLAETAEYYLEPLAP